MTELDIFMNGRRFSRIVTYMKDYGDEHGWAVFTEKGGLQMVKTPIFLEIHISLSNTIYVQVKYPTNTQQFEYVSFGAFINDFENMTNIE